jgi:transposase
MRIAYKFRIFPTKAQRTRLEDTLEQCRLLYNAGLEQRRSAYQRQHVSLSKARQQADLPSLKAAYPEFSEVYSQVLQDVLARLDRAFDAFFRRVKTGVAPQLTVVTRTIARSGVEVLVKDARAAWVVSSVVAAHETPAVPGRSSNDR